MNSDEMYQFVLFGIEYYFSFSGLSFAYILCAFEALAIRCNIAIYNQNIRIVYKTDYYKIYCFECFVECGNVQKKKYW